MENSIPSFDKTFEKLQNYIKNSYYVEEFSEKFSKLKLNHEKVDMAYQAFQEAGLLPEVSDVPSKCSKESVAFREKGNKEFLQKKDLLAIQTYSASVAFALLDSVELALAFANRSAVTYRLKEYKSCIEDIDRAVAGKYPKHLLYKLFERKGKCQKCIGLNSSAKETFKLALDTLALSNLDSSKIKSISSSLIECMNSCSENDSYVEPQRKCLPTLTGNDNDVILSASSLIKMEYSRKLGRHLIATADIEPGSTLVIEKPFASVLLPTYFTNYCFHCKKRCHSLIPCLHCFMAMFCNEECMSACWEQTHRVECSLNKMLVVLDFSKIDLIAVRTLLMATKQYKSLEELLKVTVKLESTDGGNPKTNCLDENGHYNSADYISVHRLVGNVKLRSNADIFRRAATAAYIVHFLSKSTDYFSSASEEKINEIFSNCQLKSPVSSVKMFIGGLLLHYLMIVPSNAHEISEMVLQKGNSKKVDFESTEIGGALYPIMSLMNHSCDPNVVRNSHNGDLNVLTAIKFIAAGEHIEDNYGYHHALHDVNTRQSKLYRQYYFFCQCIACRDDWPLYEKLRSSKPVYLNPRLKGELEKSSEIFQGVLADIKAGSAEGKLSFLYAHLSLLHRTVQRPWKEYSACQEAIKQCLSLQGNQYGSH